jgi:pimeloyl-ACP methyl ester carboxylesterase
VFGENANVPPGYFTDADLAAYRQAWAQPGAITAGVNYYRAAHLLDYFDEADRQEFLDWWTRPEGAIGGERFFDRLRPVDVFGEAGAPPTDDLFDDAVGRAIVVPTLLMVGENEDFSLTDHSNWFEQRVPQGTLVRIANAGHRVIHEQAGLVTEHIRGFIGV